MAPCAGTKAACDAHMTGTTKGRKLERTLTTLVSVLIHGVLAMALILGVDRFLSTSRALTNMIGNGVGTLVIARWEGELGPPVAAG